MPEPVNYNDPRAMDAPTFTSEELSAARAYINHQRKNFRLQLDYANDVRFSATATIRGDIAPTDEAPDV